MNDIDLLSVIIVTYNNAADITQCLKSVAQNVLIPHEIIIIDNNSSDDTLKRIKSSEIKVKLLSQTENLGFSKANNIGAESADGKYLLFLNPDTEIIDHSINKITNPFIKNDIGITAPQLVMLDDKVQLSVRRLPTLINSIREYWLGQKTSYDFYLPKSDQPTEVEAVVGAAILISKKLFLQVQGFDEKFFMYYEDLDLCRKVRKHGYKILYLPNVQIKHKVGSSSGTNPKSLEYFKQSAQKYHGFFNYFAIQYVIKISQIINKYFFRVIKDFGSIFLLAIAIRLIIMPLTFHTDLKTQYFHANLLTKGVINVYEYMRINKDSLGFKDTFVYPELAYLTLGSWAYVIQPVLGQPFQDWLYDWGENRWTNPQLFRQLFILKLPYLFLDLLCGVLIAYLVEESLRKKALIIWFFNPITLYIIYALANFDIIPTFLTLFSLFLFQKNKLLASGLSLGLGISLKLFPLLLLPFFMLFLLRKINKKGLVLFITGVTLMVILTLCLFFQEFLATSGSGMASQILIPTLTLTNNLKIPIFYLLYPLLLLCCLFSKDTWESLNIYILAVFWLVLSLIHFHPQWLLWSLPFFVIIVAKDLKLLIQSGVILISFILLISTFEDNFLTLGIFSPIFPQIYDVANLEQTIFAHIPKSSVEILGSLLFILVILTVLIPQILSRLNFRTEYLKRFMPEIK